MTDWAAEGVTRGEFYIALFYVAGHMWLEFRRQKIDIESSPGKHVARLAVNRLGEMDTMLREIRDRLPKEKATGTCAECSLIALPDGRIGCIDCGRRTR